jgi:hypothetical protein
MKIGYFGDSYCAGTPEYDTYGYDDNGDFSLTSWPSITAQLVNGSMTSHCISGDTLWHTYEYLCNSIKDYDVVIICVSDPIRTPNKYKIPTIGKQFDKVLASTSIKEEEIKQYAQYLDLKYYFEPKEYKYAAQIGVLYKLDELLGQHDKKSLILPSFENSLQGYKFQNASCININLNDDIKVRMLSKSNLLKVKDLDRVNHFFKKENEVLGKAVADFILNNNVEKTINFKKYFEYLDN